MAFHGRSGHLLNSTGTYSVELLKKSDLYGGEGGGEFDDKADIKTPPIVRISAIHVWSALLVDAIQVEYLLVGGNFLLGNKHGEGNSNNLTTVTFAEGEELVGLEGQTGDNYVDQISFITKKQDGSDGKYGPFGRIGKETFTISGKILGFYGFSGLLIDKIGAYYIF